MSEENISSGKSKWSRILAIIFAALFAIFWSLGGFFFWLFLGCGVYFTFLSFYFSDIKFNFFERSQNNRDPYRAYQGAPGSSGQATQHPVVRVVRIIVFSAIGFFTFLFFVGVFFGEDTTADNNASPSNETSETATATEATDDISKGNAFLNDGNYDSALWYYERVLKKKPDDQEGLYSKSLVYAMKQNYRQSIPIARKCLAAYPNYNEAWWLLGYDYNGINNLDSAIYSLERAYNNDFRETGFLELMGEAYLKSGANDKAKEFYLKVIDKDSVNMNACKALIQLDPENTSRYQRRISEQGK